MTKALDVFTSLEISDETAKVNLMQENKSKLPPTPVSEILPRGNYFNENEDDLQRLLPSYMEIILFYEWTFFFTLLAIPFDTLCYQNSYLKRRVLISSFVTLLRTRFQRVKLFPTAKWTKISQMFLIYEIIVLFLWPVLRLGRTKNITKTKRFPPNYVGPVKTCLKSNGYEIIGFFFLRPVLRPGRTKNVTKMKRFSLTTSAQWKLGWNTIALIYQWLWPFNVFVFPQRRKCWFIEGNHLEMSLSDCLRPDDENLASQ